MTKQRKKWLAAIVCGLITMPVCAADFEKIQLWYAGGWSNATAIQAGADGTLAIGHYTVLDKPPPHNVLEIYEPCARATEEEMERLSGLVRQIPT
jgi:hypothetical protein